MTFSFLSFKTMQHFKELYLISDFLDTTHLSFQCHVSVYLHGDEDYQMTTIRTVRNQDGRCV